MSEKKSTVLRTVPDERVAPHANGMPVMIALILSFIILTGGLSSAVPIPTLFTAFS